MCAIEEAGAEMRASGALTEWFAMCEERVRRVSATVNGALFAELLREGGHKEPDCADIFREGKNNMKHAMQKNIMLCTGAEMYEKLKKSGIGEEIECVEGRSVEELRQKSREHNETLEGQFKEVTTSEKLLEAAWADAELGRMTEPIDITSGIPHDVLLHPRFGVEQLKEDGSKKVTPVDHMSWSPGEPELKQTKKQLKANSINGYTWPQEKMRPDTLDKFISVLKTFVAVVGCLPGLWKVESCVPRGNSIHIA